MEKIKAFFMAHYVEILGWAGVVLLQGATLPPMIKRLLGSDAPLPPLEMTLMVWLGLLCYLGRGIIQQDRVYITSNSIGLLCNSILLYMIAVQ